MLLEKVSSKPKKTHLNLNLCTSREVLAYSASNIVDFLCSVKEGFTTVDLCKQA